MRVIKGENASPGLSVIRSQSRVSRESERGREIEIGFMDTCKIRRMKRDKVEKFNASHLKTSIPLNNPERVRGKLKQEG